MDPTSGGLGWVDVATVAQRTAGSTAGVQRPAGCLAVDSPSGQVTKRSSYATGNSPEITASRFTCSSNVASALSSLSLRCSAAVTARCWCTSTRRASRRRRPTPPQGVRRRFVACRLVSWRQVMSCGHDPSMGLDARPDTGRSGSWRRTSSRSAVTVVAKAVKARRVLRPRSGAGSAAQRRNAAARVKHF